MLLAGALLIAALGALTVEVWRDARDYAVFKTMTETAERQRFYRRWLTGSFVLFLAGGLAALAALARLDDVLRLPSGFAGLSRDVRGAIPPGVGPGVLGGVIAGALGGAVLSMVAARRGAGAGAVMLGDISALLPRNGAETWLAALLSLNAGVSEELFFRLLLPLLIVLLTGNAPLAFIAAAVAFGLSHVYQGWVGVAATTLLGLVLTAIYLWTGQLWVAMAAHAGLDLLGLVVRPSLARLAMAPPRQSG